MSNFVDQLFAQFSRRRSIRRRPIRLANLDEEAFLLEVLFEHVECFRDQADRGVLIGPRLESLQEQRSVAKGDQANRERDRRTDRIL